MKKYLVSLLLVGVLMISSLSGCGFIRVGTGTGNENDELQAQIEALQSQLDALNEATEEETEEETEEITEEETEEATEEETKNDVPAGDAEVSADWATYEFSVNGKTLTLPCTYAELAEATGFSMKSSDSKSYLESGYYCNVNLYTAEEDLALYIDILNDTDEDAVYTDCIVTSIWQSDSQVSNYGANPITFAAGLQVGKSMTTDELESLFGEPNDTYEYIGDDPDFPYECYKWTYSEDPDKTYHNCIEVSIVNDVIDEIELEHLYYE